MVTLVPKDFRTDEGLVHLMGKLKVDGIKIGEFRNFRLYKIRVKPSLES